MINPYTSPDFKPGGVAYGFFGRKGGVSTGVYASLNVRAGSNDDPQAVAENRARICEALGADPKNLLTLYQTHSDKVLTAEKSWNPARPEGDGVVTDRPGLALGILTADCCPVLFAGTAQRGRPVIGAAHAGWRGAVGGVLENTVQAMQALGVEDIEACIGPSIARRSYEVSQEFWENLIKMSEENERFFASAPREGHYLFDLSAYAAQRLKSCGVRKVVLSDVDTYSAPEDYFSFRRSTHKGETDYGGQVSAIMIKS